MPKHILARVVDMDGARHTDMEATLLVRDYAAHTQYTVTLPASQAVVPLSLGQVKIGQFICLEADKPVSVAFDGSIERRTARLVMLAGTTFESIDVIAQEGAVITVFVAGGANGE